MDHLSRKKWPLNASKIPGRPVWLGLGEPTFDKRRIYHMYVQVSGFWGGPFGWYPKRQKNTDTHRGNDQKKEVLNLETPETRRKSNKSQHPRESARSGREVFQWELEVFHW